MVAPLAPAGAAGPEGRLEAPPVTTQAAMRARDAVAHEVVPVERGKLFHRFRFPDGGVVEFTDRPRRSSERAARRRVVVFDGLATAATEPASTFEGAGIAAGLPAGAVAALRLVSSHEGGFDAINTWDSARFSWGFIQFAGGRGLPPLLAHMKLRSPELFATVLANYGVDVLPDANGVPEPIYVDGETGQLVRGKAAEQAFGDDPLVIALFIHAASYPAVRQLQVEAAIRDYVTPALTATCEGIPIGQVLSSPMAQAMLIDRRVHEGNVSRLRRALHAVSDPLTLANPAAWPVLEARALQQVVSSSGGTAGQRLRDIVNAGLPGPIAAAY
jgi:peptidoglycan endopeptidase LytF